MKTQPTFRRSLIIGLAIAVTTSVWGLSGAGAQTPTTVGTTSCAQADVVSALVLVDNPTEVDPAAPLVRQEVAGVVLADLVRLGAEDRTVEVAVGRMGQELNLVAPWAPLDQSTYQPTLAAFTATPSTATPSLATAIEGAHQELVDRVGEDGCGIVVTMPIGTVAITADEASALCASGGTIDSLRSLPAHLGIITTPTAIAGAERSLLDTVAGAAGSEESCGSVSADGAVIVGATRSELLAPAGRFVDDLSGATVAPDETDVCQVFACAEGSTTIEAGTGVDVLSFEGVFNAFGYGVVLEAPNGKKVTLPAGTETTTKLAGSTVTALWPSDATVSITVAGDVRPGPWTATVIDTAAAGGGSAQWQRSVSASLVPVIVAVSPTAAGGEALVEVELMDAAGERVDAATASAVVLEGTLVDTVTGSSSPIEFGEIVDGAYIGNVQLTDGMGPDAEIIVALDGGEPVVMGFTVEATTPTPTTDAGESSSDGLLSMRNLAIAGLVLAAIVLVFWLRSRRSAPVESPTEVRRGSFEVVIGPDDHISRVIDAKTHPLFFRGPDFTTVTDPGSGVHTVDDLQIAPNSSWNPLRPRRGRARSSTGPVVGSEGRAESDETLVGLVSVDLARSWAFVLDIDATAHANQFETAPNGVVRGHLHVFIDDALTASNDWLTKLVEDLPNAGRGAYEWANTNGLTEVRLGVPPLTGTYAEFASMVTD